ncbi:MAG: M48 family metalloprotease [Deltaproteobacteria bacterium]|nr:M48 family metalloprotease [Deltaproteobacteria bacterium]
MSAVRIRPALTGVLALVLSGGVLSACTSGPPPDDSEVVGRGPSVLETQQDDRDVGRSAAEQVKHEMGLVEDGRLEVYVQKLGRRIAQGAGGFRYEFHVVDQAAPNAFALPGGHIYLSRGLLQLANSEDELACVLGHEIVHVAARHAAARQHVQRTTANPLMLPGIVLGSVFGEKVGRATSEPLRSFNAPYVASFSRDQERTADQQGQRMAARAGFDPAGMASFLDKLSRYESVTFGYSRLPSFMDSHPMTGERLNTASAEAGLIRWHRQPGVAKNHESFLGKVEGLVVGPPASEGVFIGDRFLHPDLDFSIRFPRNWRTVNAQMAVGAVAPSRNVQIFLSQPTRGTDPKAAARALAGPTPTGSTHARPWAAPASAASSPGSRTRIGSIGSPRSRCRARGRTTSGGRGTRRGASAR